MMTASQERQPILVSHTVQVDTGRCYSDGTPTQTVCFVCRRYACKAHSINLRTHEVGEWREHGYGCIQYQRVHVHDLGLVCLDHKDAGDPCPPGYPKFRMALWAKIVFPVACVMLLIAAIVVSIH